MRHQILHDQLTVDELVCCTVVDTNNEVWPPAEVMRVCREDDEEMLSCEKPPPSAAIGPTMR